MTTAAMARHLYLQLIFTYNICVHSLVDLPLVLHPSLCLQWIQSHWEEDEITHAQRLIASEVNVDFLIPSYLFTDLLLL